MYLKNLKTQSTRWKVWLKQAKYDLSDAELCTQNAFYEWGCYQSEQCVEKYLKAVLVRSGYRPPKIHKISILLGICNKVDRDFAQTQFLFRNIESFTFISRYPFLVPGENNSPHEYITKEDADSSIMEAREFYHKITDLFRNDILEEDDL